MGSKNSANSKLIQGHTISIPTQGPLKPLFPHSIKWRCTDPADFAYINKLRPKFLSNINFSNKEVQNPGSKAIRSFHRVLTDAKRSSNLSIEDSKLNPKQLHHILNSTNHLKTIKIYPARNELDSSHLSKSLTRIGRNKNLSELTVSNFNYVQGDETCCIRKQLKKLRKLKSLDLNNEVLLSFQPLRFLKSLGISFKQNFSMRLPDLLSNLSKCDRFTELTLDFHHVDQIDLQETQLWTSFFQKAQSLENLTFFRSFSVSQDYSGFQVFPNCFRFMKRLTALRVHLDISADDHDPVFFIDFFFDSLKSLPQLKKLEFTTAGSYILKDDQIKNLVTALECLKNLRILDFDILRLDLTSERVMTLAKTLQKLSCLKHLKLKCGENRNLNKKLTYTAVKTFAKSLTHLQLKSLDLALSDQPILLDDLITRHKVPFLSALSSLKDLSILHLDLSAFTPPTWKRFYLNPKNLCKLTSLSVVLGRFNYADNYGGLSKFMLCLKVMPNLTTLKLSGAIVLDQELDLFLRNLDGCPNLHRLELTFQNADHLKEKALDSLQAALVKLTKLEYLEVNLWRRDGFGNDIVNKFLYGLIVLKRLKELAANFERSPSFFPHLAWKGSMQKLKNCKYLTKVEIDRVRYL